VDQFGMAHDVPEGSGPVLRRTELGGALTLAAFGCMVGNSLA
jgi:hypothetical protein